MIGPITNPDMPNIIIPPTVEKNTTRGCIWISLPTKTGLRKLSTKPTIKAPMRIVAPCHTFPKTNITTPAGIRMTPGPTAGMIATMTIMTPQMKAPSTPVNQNNSPLKIPWIPPIIKVLFNVARVVDVNLPKSISSYLSPRGE